MPQQAENMISKQACRTARTMAETIFSEYRVTSTDRDRLLSALTILSLRDLLSGSSLSWDPESTSGTGITLRYGEKDVCVRESTGSFFLKSNHSDEEVERAYDDSEELLDRYNIPDLERATLFTALPCLGLWALRDCIEWNEAPPFPEVAEGG